ncbi:MAG: UDP-3-O-(3-hydroxymyristoyl)glucosamine N-acyltransferase [Gammaproteobacteria bacterium]|nr:UDP-3-O-(3-hydroxymyristoyl)glucosamine N-acyltransferase [Gammaproteobacteria bacterium]
MGTGAGFTLAELAQHVNARVVGDGSCRIRAVATLQQARADQISFLSNKSYKPQLKTTRAAAVILHPNDVSDCPVNALVVNNPHAAYARIAQLLNPVPMPLAGIHASAVVDPHCSIDVSARIGPYAVIEAEVVIAAGVYIGPHCIISRDSHIGRDSRLVANVTVCHGSRIGERVLIHPGSVIGSDGFGQAYDQGRWLKVPQLGRVIIGNDVEIGACTTIDRGAIDDTIIDEGVKLDNLIQIAHNVQVGAHTVMAGCTGIAGSTRIGKHCLIGGGVGIAGHLSIADGVTITGMSLVIKDIDKPGSYSSGVPVEESQQWHRTYLRMKRLDELLRRVRSLEKKNDVLLKG